MAMHEMIRRVAMQNIDTRDRVRAGKYFGEKRVGSLSNPGNITNYNSPTDHSMAQIASLDYTKDEDIDLWQEEVQQGIQESGWRGKKKKVRIILSAPRVTRSPVRTSVEGFVRIETSKHCNPGDERISRCDGHKNVHQCHDQRSSIFQDVVAP